MSETERLVQLWKRAKARGESVYLATVVHVEGSSYRKPGARMLVTGSGERAGTISGGCLEAEVSRKIRWFTQNGPSVEEYRSSFDDDNEGVPYGLGCGGKIWILMESGRAVDEVMGAYSRALEDRISSVIVSSIGASGPISSSVVAEDELDASLGDDAACVALARRALSERRCTAALTAAGGIPEFVCIPVMPPPVLRVFGAGDDAQPLVRFAVELGWDVYVADGRAHLVRPERFPEAKGLLTLKYEAFDSAGRAIRVATDPLVAPGDRAVILTHSYEQDRALLKALLPQTLEYLGILGPLRRTVRIVDEIKGELGLSRDECLERLHAPVGLPLGSGGPAVIALSIVAEIQATSAKSSGSEVAKRSQSEAIPMRRTPRDAAREQFSRLERV